jgi:hypothetical protein
MVFNATFNNISVILWRSVLLVVKTWIPGENHRPAANHWQTLSHNVVSSTPCHEQGSTSQLWRGYALIAHVVVNPTTIRSRPPLPRIETEYLINEYVINCQNIFHRIIEYSSEQEKDRYLTPSEKLFCYIKLQVAFRWYYDHVYLVHEQHNEIMIMST